MADDMKYHNAIIDRVMLDTIMTHQCVIKDQKTGIEVHLTREPSSGGIGVVLGIPNMVMDAVNGYAKAIQPSVQGIPQKVVNKEYYKQLENKIYKTLAENEHKTFTNYYQPVPEEPPPKRPSRLLRTKPRE